MTAERRTFPLRARIAKWSGAWLGTAAWFADQQIVSMAVYADCPASSRELTVGVGVACILVALLGAWHSWRARRDLPAAAASSASLRTDRFIATLSLLLACISILAIVFGTTAGLVLRCER